MKVSIKIVGFVDDTRNSTNKFSLYPSPSMETLINQATTVSQLWHDLLEASNQAFELPNVDVMQLSMIS